MSVGKNSSLIPKPTCRRIRAYAFDPILSRDVKTCEINAVTIKLPWQNDVQVGPVDDYLEVIDYDPASQSFYPPVDLNESDLLAQDGLPPSESNPLFHQQMAYTVARTTIDYFEHALGRKALWSSRFNRRNTRSEEFIERLRVYPHAMREANAYYSPVKKALLFGYFPASLTEPGKNMPGENVFSCLSHDIIAHETTHALIDGLHPRFIEPSNVDVLALHEAIADIVALFQHFTYPELLRSQIACTRGDLENQNLLGQLAYQFGQAIGNHGALRSAIGHEDPISKKWIPEEPNQKKILYTSEPHARGAILVAAVFSAFLTTYKRRITDLIRIASGGIGILPQGDLNADLVDRLASEAAKTARHMLHICIRALDYCPPVDVDFGDYLRALITADAQVVSDDKHNYRLAIIEAFRCRGIFPRDVYNLSEENLLWQVPNDQEQAAFLRLFEGPEKLRTLVPDWGLSTNRKIIYDQARDSQMKFHKWFTSRQARDAVKVSHMVMDKSASEAYFRKESGVPTLEIHSVRPARRIGPDGQTVTELVIEMTQRRKGYFDVDMQKKADSGKLDRIPKPDFIMRGGCTILVSPDTAKVRYCIYKRIGSATRLERMRKYLVEDESTSLRATYFGEQQRNYYEKLIQASEMKGKEFDFEMFAILHRSYDAE